MNYKTEVQNNNEIIQNIISSLQELPDISDAQEGLYVWAKYEYLNDITIENPSLSCSKSYGATKIEITNPNFDLTLLPNVEEVSETSEFLFDKNGEIISNFFSELESSSTGLNFEINNDGLCYGTTSAVGNVLSFTVNSSTSATMKISSYSSYDYSAEDFSYTGIKYARKAQKGSFINFIVSNNISAYPEKGLLDNYWYEKINLLNLKGWYTYSSSEGDSLDTPYDFSGRHKAVLWNGEIHIICGEDSTTAKNHYKWNGKIWESVSELPYEYAQELLVCNNELHILGSISSSNNTKHYKYNGTTWESVSTLPVSVTNSTDGCAVVLNNQIHLFSGTSHYRWNGSAWTSISTLPSSFTYSYSPGLAFIYNNNLCVALKGSDSVKSYVNFYQFKSNAWTSIGSISFFYFTGCSIFEVNNKLHLIGGYYSTSGSSTSYNYHYIYNDGNFMRQKNLSFEFQNGSVVVENEKVHILNGDLDNRLRHIINEDIE